jgi:hypothetical protein
MRTYSMKTVPLRAQVFLESTELSINVVNKRCPADDLCLRTGAW